MRFELLPTKTCRTCGEEKPVSEFYKRLKNRDGYQTRCKQCYIASVHPPVMEETRKKDREAVLEYLEEHGETRKMTIAKALGISGARLRKSTDILENEGKISRRRDGHNAVWYDIAKEFEPGLLIEWLMRPVDVVGRVAPPVWRQAASERRDRHIGRRAA